MADDTKYTAEQVAAALASGTATHPCTVRLTARDRREYAAATGGAAEDAACYWRGGAAGATRHRYSGRSGHRPVWTAAAAAVRAESRAAGRVVYVKARLDGRI